MQEPPVAPQFEVGQPVGQQQLHALMGCGAGVADVEDLADLSEGETGTHLDARVTLVGRMP